MVSAVDTGWSQADFFGKPKTFVDVPFMQRGCAVACGRNHRLSEAGLVLALQEVERARLHRLLDCPSLFA